REREKDGRVDDSQSDTDVQQTKDRERRRHRRATRLRMKICSVVGTRPNFVKEYLLNLELKRRGIREVLVHTGQHHDYEMSQAFFDCFDLQSPDYHLQIANSDGLSFGSRAITELGPMLLAAP